MTGSIPFSSKHDRSLPAQRISLLHTEYTVLHLTMRLSKHLVIFIQGDKTGPWLKIFQDDPGVNLN